MSPATVPQRLVARVLRSAESAAFEEAMAPRKARLLGPLRGTVVEIGPGRGVNLRHLAPSVAYVAVEPNALLHAPLRAEADRLGHTLDLRPATLDAAGLPDAFADAVVSTHVLCSVPRLDAALADIRRVLRPGGRFVFVEHVGAPPGTWRRRLQALVQPPWTYFGDGCRPDRDTEAAIRAAGFASVDVERFAAPLPALVRPHIAGLAVR